MTESTTAPVSSVQNVASSSPKKATKKTTKGKSTQGASHPKYSDMIKAALKSLNDRSGSSRAAILKYVLANYSLDPVQANQHLKLALKNGVKAKYFKQTKGNGASGSFKLVENVKPAKKKSTKPKKAKSATSSTASAGTKKRARSKSAGSKPAKKVATTANTNNSAATASSTTAAAPAASATAAAAKPKKVKIAKTSTKSASATKTKKPKQGK